jgi:hypothetical protein
MTFDDGTSKYLRSPHGFGPGGLETTPTCDDSRTFVLSFQVLGSDGLVTTTMHARELSKGGEGTKIGPHLNIFPRQSSSPELRSSAGLKVGVNRAELHFVF